MPIWERETWKYLFNMFGPLDWRRADFLCARVNQYQAMGDAQLKDFLLFRDPSEKGDDEKDKEEELLKKLGWTEGE